jgi:hypothetical protein
MTGYISMHARFLAAFVVPAALLLAGCYVTTKPIITPANAAYPFADGTTFTAWSWEEDKKEWEPSGSGKVIRVADRYRLKPDPEPGEQPDAEDEVLFLLADLGGGVYAAQAQENDDNTILLDIAKVEGDTVYQYVLMCGPDDKKLADQGIIETYEHAEFADTCAVGSLDQLRRAFEAKLAAGMVPRAKYVKTR